MLEIILVVYLSKNLGNKAKEKGYKSGGYIFMFVMFWILGEFIGGIIGSLLIEGFGLYIFALIGAALGALISFGIVNNLKAKTEPDIIDQL